MEKKILIVVTNHSDIQEGRKTGIWLTEFAEAYIEFIKKGYQVTVASPLGGRSPIDPNSVNDETPKVILETAAYLDHTVSIRDVFANDFDAVFLPGGHGTMYDLPDNQILDQLVRDFYESGKIVAAVCHGPAGLTGVKLSDGQPLVAGKRVNAFTDREEAQTGLDKVLPFLLESKLRELGAVFVAAPDWASHHEVDGNLITGQNPQSTLAVTKAAIEKLG